MEINIPDKAFLVSGLSGVDLYKDLFTISKNENEKYMSKVPSMRNIEHTGPYFHEGIVNNQEESVKIMAKVQLSYNISDAEVNNIAVLLKSSLSADVPESVRKAPAALAAK